METKTNYLNMIWFSLGKMGETVYETIRKFESFDDFLQVSALITKKYDSALRKRYKKIGAMVHSIEDILEGPAQIWPQLNDNSIDRLTVSFSWDYRLRDPGPVIHIKLKDIGVYLYQFLPNGAGDEETKLLYAVATALFQAKKIEEVKK